MYCNIESAEHKLMHGLCNCPFSICGKQKRMKTVETKLILPGESTFLPEEEYGYTADNEYAVSISSSGGEFSFALRLSALPVPKTRRWTERDEDKLRMGEMLAGMLSFRAVSEGRTAGIVIAERTKWNNSVYLEKLHVSKSFRNLGVGRGLIRAVETSAVSQGAEKLCLETQNTNSSAVNFYMKCGFEITGLDTALYSGDECKGETAVFMTKQLK